MTTSEEIRNELDKIVKEKSQLMELIGKDDILGFGRFYQNWYSRALKLVSLLGPDRFDEFRSYYLIDPKRKTTNVDNYVIQDYVKAVGAPTDNYTSKPRFDTKNITGIRLINQTDIIRSLSSRIDGILVDVKGHLFAEMQDEELKEAQKLMAINLRAAGAVAGVVLERHLQRAANNHNIEIKKKNPTISDLNDPLKNEGIYDIPIWRKIQLMADLRNICSPNKQREPTREEVEELIEGANSIIKTVF
ncbi:MAG: hypothetical protein E4G89_02185 [Methanothrix sp.]|nr:MAG: hypothetical protein E4G89_02185 [Methanothrix sp.]